MSLIGSAPWLMAPGTVGLSAVPAAQAQPQRLAAEIIAAIMQSDSATQARNDAADAAARDERDQAVEQWNAQQRAAANRKLIGQVLAGAAVVAVIYLLLK